MAETPLTESDNILQTSVYKYSVAKRALSIFIALLPVLTVPFLYFIGRAYELSYYAKVGVPFGILNNEFTETLLSGFLYGIVESAQVLLKLMTGWLPYLKFIFGLLFISLFFPKTLGKLNTLIEWPFKKAGTRVGKEKALEYIESVENNFTDSKLLAQTWLIIEFGAILSLMLFITLWPAKNAIENAEKNAIKFITTSDKANCHKSNKEDCQSFVKLTMKSTKKPKEGFIVTSGPKEWAIYQPPYITKTKIGQLIIVKRADIVEVSHQIQLSALVDEPDNTEKPKVEAKQGDTSLQTQKL